MTQQSSSRGRPKYYSNFDDAAFELSPVPDANYSVELHYLHQPASLTSGAESGTTLLSTDYPDALLYGSLAEAAIFLKETPDVIANMEQRFMAAIGQNEKPVRRSRRREMSIVMIYYGQG
jgi:hypothetical protein